MSTEIIFTCWHLIKTLEPSAEISIFPPGSLNEDEPIVSTPREAPECFPRTRTERNDLKAIPVARKDRGRDR